MKFFYCRIPILYLDSNDSLIFHLTNTPDEFIVTFPERHIERMLGMCALEITMHFSDDKSLSRLYVCCDIVEDSYVRKNNAHFESRRRYRITILRADHLH